MRIFEKDADYEAFIHVLHEGLEKYSVELFSFTLTPSPFIPSATGHLGAGETKSL